MKTDQISDSLPYASGFPIHLTTSGAIKWIVPATTVGACDEFVNKSLLKVISTAKPKSANFTLLSAVSSRFSPEIIAYYKDSLTFTIVVS